MRTIIVMFLVCGLAVAQAPPASTADASQLTIPSGTKVPLALKQSLSTKNAREGDAVYAVTTFPVVINDRIVIPAGTYVQGRISERQAGWTNQGPGRSPDALQHAYLSQRLHGGAARRGRECSRGRKDFDERRRRHDPPGQPDRREGQDRGHGRRDRGGNRRPQQRRQGRPDRRRSRRRNRHRHRTSEPRQRRQDGSRHDPGNGDPARSSRWMPAAFRGSVTLHVVAGALARRF